MFLVASFNRVCSPSASLRACVCVVHEVVTEISQRCASPQPLCGRDKRHTACSRFWGSCVRAIEVALEDLKHPTDLTGTVNACNIGKVDAYAVGDWTLVGVTRIPRTHAISMWQLPQPTSQADAASYGGAVTATRWATSPSSQLPARLAAALLLHPA